MNWIKKNWFELSLIICFFIVAISIAFYFLVFLPSRKNVEADKMKNQSTSNAEQQIQPVVSGDSSSVESLPLNTSGNPSTPKTSEPVTAPVNNQATTSLSKTYSEGWIEKLKPNANISGWAFDNNKPLIVNLTFKEITIGYEATLSGRGDTNNGSSGSFNFSFRSDVEDIVRQKGIEPFVRTGFQLHFSGGALPSGYYQLTKATFNGHNFHIQSPETVYHFQNCRYSNGQFICE